MVQVWQTDSPEVFAPLHTHTHTDEKYQVERKQINADEEKLQIPLRVFSFVRLEAVNVGRDETFCPCVRGTEGICGMQEVPLLRLDSSFPRCSGEIMAHPHNSVKASVLPGDIKMDEDCS